MRILWNAFVAAIVIYGIIVWLLRNPGDPPTTAAAVLPILRPVFYAFGLLEFLLSFVLRRRLGGSLGAGSTALGSSMPASGRVPPAANGGGKAAPPPGAILGWALLESVAILGLVLGLLGRGLIDAFPLLLLAFLGMLLQRPD
jgi:hypothetical protein